MCLQNGLGRETLENKGFRDSTPLGARTRSAQDNNFCHPKKLQTPLENEEGILATLFAPPCFTIFWRVFGAKIPKTQKIDENIVRGWFGETEISEPKKRENTIKIGVSRPSLGGSGPKEPSKN